MDSVPENQCIVQFDLACAFLRGEVVEATLVDGSKYFGRFHACSSDADGLTVVLNYCSTTSRTAGDMDQVIIPGSQLMELQATDIAFNEITRSKQLYNSALATDAEIAQHAKSNGDKRELEMVSSDWLDGSEMDLEASARGAEKFDQFEVNKKKFGVHTEFNEEEYTTPLDVASFDAATVSRAHRTANEIENKQRLKKRGQRQLTEDELFSDVRAGPRTNTGNAWAKPVPLAHTLGTKPGNAAGKAGGSGGAYAPPFRRGADAPVAAKDAVPAASAVARGATTEALREFSEKIDPAKVKGGQRISGGAKKPAGGAAPTAPAGTSADPAAAPTAVAPAAPPALPAAKAQAVTDDATTAKLSSSGDQPTVATDPVKPATDAPAPAPASAPKKLNPNAAEFRPTPTSIPPAQAPGMPHPHSMPATGHAPAHMHMGMQQHQPGMRQPYWHPHHPPMYMPQQMGMMMQYPPFPQGQMMHGMHPQPQHMMQMPGAGGPGGHRGGGNAGGGRGRGGHRGGMRGGSGRGRGGGRGGGAAGHAGSPVPSVSASPAGSPGQAQ